MRNNLFTKLLISYLVVTLVTLAVVGVALSQLFANYFYTAKERELERKGQELARIVAVYHSMGQTLPVDPLLNTLATFLDARVMIIDRGNLIRDENSSLGAVQFFLTDEEAQQILEGNMVSKRRHFQQPEQIVLSVAVPIYVYSSVAGALVLTSPVAGMAATVSSMRLLILYAAIGAVFLSALLGFYLSRSISRPLSRMSEVTREMTKGNFQQRVEVTSGDEVGRLAEDFNHLAGSLEQTISALSLEKSKIENILANMTEGVLAVDNSGQVLLANGAVFHTLQLDETGVLENTPTVFAGCPGLAELFDKVISSGQPCSAEFNLDEGKQFIVAHLAPLRETTGESYGAVGVLQDITELRKLELLRRDFVANVSHELRTPLTSMQGFLEALLDGTIEDGRSREHYLQIIHRETLRLNRLIHDLLDLSLIESGKVSWELNPIDVADLINQVLLKLSPQLEGQQVRVEQKIPTALPLMLGNEDRVEQVLTNLLENAVRYSRPGTTVTITAVEKDGYITVAITDQGTGIPAEDLPHIWERFHRVEKSRSRHLGGTGLGLAIVKQIVEIHGGRVQVSSALGQGSTFSFTLTVVPAEE